MNVLQLLAHAEDLHSESTSELEHLLTSAQVAIPLYIALNLALFYGLKQYKKELVMPVIFGVNLVLGVLSFDIVPAVSIMAITVGITSALAVTLALLSQG